MTSSTGFAGGASGPDHLRPLVSGALDALAKGAVDRDGPLPTGGPGAVADLVRGVGELLPEDGAGEQHALDSLVQAFAAGSADPADPACAAHLHAPPLAVAVAADVAASAVNSSLDSWDQGPSGAEVESRVLEALAALVGFGPEAGGSVTSGGTESNLTGLLLAREHAPAGRARVYCSAEAHFSVARAAGVLGLGEDAVVAVPVDEQHRMDPAALRRLLAESEPRGELPVAVVATAGTTDFGAIDPLPEIAEIAAERSTWLHVDAAYGGGALFSDRLVPLLRGVERADSVALDLHKLGWQPVAAGVLLARSAELFAPLQRRVSYLNSDDDEEAGYGGLLGRSLRTTRRADALKMAVSLRSLGRRGFGELVDRCHDLARFAADRVREAPDLELLGEPVLTAVVFRYLPDGDPDQTNEDQTNEDRTNEDQVNAGLRRALLDAGRAVVGRTEVGGAVALKLTLLNPHAREADVTALLEAVRAAGEVAAGGRGRAGR